MSEVWAYVFIDTENPGPTRLRLDVRVKGVSRGRAARNPDVIAIVKGDHMLDGDGGVVMQHRLSIFAATGMPLRAAYAASKQGVMRRSCAVRGVCVRTRRGDTCNADRGDARPRALESRHRSSMTLAAARSISASRAAWPSGRGTNGSNTT